MVEKQKQDILFLNMCDIKKKKKNVDTTKFKGELRDMDEKFMLVNSDVTRLKAENARLESQLKGVANKVPLSELSEQIDTLEVEVAEISKRLSNARSAQVRVVSKEEKKQVHFNKNNLKSPSKLFFSLKI
jgi:predicted  nucleic acid-binding Zn-ribbon protein